MNLSGTYSLPPADIIRWVDAPPEPSVIACPNYQWLLILPRNANPPITELAKPIAKLAGFRFQPQSRNAFQTEYWNSMELRGLRDSSGITIPLQSNARIGRVSWSQHSDAVAFTLCFEERTELWWFAVEDPEHPKCICSRVVEALCEFDWASDGKRLICFVPHIAEQSVAATAKVPRGPIIEESSAIESPARTYQDLLTNQAEAELFEQLITTQIVLVDPQSLDKRYIGKPGMYLSCASSPSDQYFLVSELKKPFSYTLPYQYFPHKKAVWNRLGEEVYEVCDLPLADRIPIEGVRVGPRHVSWLPGTDATLIWCEALDDGDPRKNVEHRDRLMAKKVPSETAAYEILRIEHRYSGRLSLAQSNLMLVTQYDRDRRWTRTLLHDIEAPEAQPRVLSDRNIHDHYGDPGHVVSLRDHQGCRVALQVGGALALSGHGASPDGALPFLDLWDLNQGKARRVWQCEPGCYESVIHVRELSDAGTLEVVTRYESKVSPPNFRMHQLNSPTSVWLTNFADPLPELREFPKRLVRYRRRDGLELSATLYLPRDFREGERLPLLLWAYPLEYSDPGTAGQMTRSPDRFTRLSGCSHLSLLTQGFAIMDNATMPVVGDPETMNDRFIEQIIESAEAAIDFAVNEGVADRERVGVGGHSYGAFMVANLMAHSNLFKAGIARSGAYNRTLTPFGFQAERRPLWQARETYQKLSPFFYADQIKQPLLFIHGDDDNNPGTLTIQSKRMYQAIKGNGGICRLVLLPFEGHGYKARESILHTQMEMVEWLNRYVRDR